MKIDSSVPRTLEDPTNGVVFEQDDFEKIKIVGARIATIPGPALRPIISGLAREVMWYEEGNREPGDSDEKRQRKYEAALITFQAAFAAAAIRSISDLLAPLFSSAPDMNEPGAADQAEPAMTGQYV